MDILKKDVCRACTSKESLLSIFEIQISDTNTVQMAEFLKTLTSIEVTKDDGLPQKLCLYCIDTVCKVYHFIQMCKESDSTFRINHNSIPDNLTSNESSQSSNPNVEEIDVQAEIKQLNKLQDFSQEADLILSTDKRDNIKTDNISEVNNYECVKCEEAFKTELELAYHTLAHDLKRSFECKQCSKSFLKKTDLTMHIRVHDKTEEKQHVCKECGQAFTYSYLLKQHSLKHKDEKPFPCSKCKKGCLTAESLRRHMKIHEDGYKKKIHACRICGKEFRYPSFLSEHMKNHTGERPFLCSICGKGFRQRGALDYHIRSHTGYKPYRCEICNNNFTCRGVLRVHMRRHTDERPYICDICGIGFRQSSDMKRHRTTHSGDKHALCTICGKQMSTTGQLTVHLRSHTGEKPFGCEVCQKAFTTRTMLIKHNRIHTGERPYTCNICGRSFNQSSSLKTHGMVHAKNTEKLKKDCVKYVTARGDKTKNEATLPAVSVPL